MSRAMGQNSLTPLGEQNSLTPEGNNNLYFRLARDQVVHLKTAANLCQPASRKYCFAVMAAKRFQTRIVEEVNSFFGLKARNQLTRPPTMP